MSEPGGRASEPPTRAHEPAIRSADPWRPTRRELALATVTAAALYAVIAINLDLFSWVDELFLSSGDATTFLAVSRWFTGGEPTGHIAQRPIAYPLVLLVYRVTGAWGGWALQAACWVASCLLISGVVMRMTGSPTWRGIAIFVFAAQVSLVVLTFHGLPESVSIALACLWLWVATGQPMARWTARRVALLLLLLALLAITKPVFQLLVLGFAPLAILWWLRHGGRTLASAALVTAGLAPLVVQIAVVYATHGLVTLSTIGVHTLRLYYGALVYQELHGLPSLESARLALADESGWELLRMLAGDPWTALRIYGHTLVRQNLLVGTPAGLLPPGGAGEALVAWSAAVNQVLAAVHAVMLLPTLWATWTRRDWLMGTCWLFAASLILSSGLSFWQGDRLVVIAVPWWLAAYTASAAHWVARGKDLYGRRRSRHRQ